MSAEFEAFTRAVSAQGGAAAAPQQAPWRRIAVLGGGQDARLLAALALAEGCEVTLFSAYGGELEALRAGSGITLRGAGPVGSYHVDRDGVAIRLTAELDRAVQGADAIFLTGPIHKQRTYAMVLADHLADGQVLVLPQGRSFAALETRWLLSMGGCQADVGLVEMPLPYWTSGAGTVLDLTQRVDVPGGVLPATCPVPASGMGCTALALSVLASSFGDFSGAIEVPALVLGGVALAQGGPVVPMGGVPLDENKTFANLIGDDHVPVLADLVDERRAVARAYGVRDLPDTDHVIEMCAGATSGPTARPVPSTYEARVVIRDAVIGSLVPLISAADLAGHAVPKTQAMVALVSSMLGADLQTVGRKLPAMGITGPSLSEARRQLDLAAGVR